MPQLGKTQVKGFSLQWKRKWANSLLTLQNILLQQQMAFAQFVEDCLAS